jgi:hypothetical protein
MSTSCRTHLPFLRVLRGSQWEVNIRVQYANVKSLGSSPESQEQKRPDSRNRDGLRADRKVCLQTGERSNPDFLDFSDADIIVAPVIEAGRFDVRVTHHGLRVKFGR